MICSFIMINLFVLVIIEQFEKYYNAENNPIEIFKGNVATFKNVWSEHSAKTQGFKIS